jgi:hypothetical protein
MSAGAASRSATWIVNLINAPAGHDYEKTRKPLCVFEQSLGNPF